LVCIYSKKVFNSIIIIIIIVIPSSSK